MINTMFYRTGGLVLALVMTIWTAPASVADTPDPEGVKAARDSALVLEQLQGLKFVGSVDAVLADGVAVEGIAIDDLDVLAGPEFRATAAKYLGRPLHLADLERLVQETVAHCREHDRPVVDVLVPEQDVTSGAVQVVVLEARLGRVTTSDNRWFENDSILGAMRLSPGDKVSASTLEEDLAWLNRNPFRQVDAVFVQGAEPGTTDVQLEVKERYPLRPYVAYNNSGNPAIGEHMVSAGLNWGNVFDTDHRAGYQYERTGRNDGLAAHRLSYTAPLPWRHELSLSASHVETDSELLDVFGLSGRSTSFSARYSLPVRAPAIAGFSHQVQAGVDFRRTNNNLEFFGTQVFDDSSDIIQLAAEYSGRLPDRAGLNRWYASLVASPGGLSGRNEDERFEAMRPGATSDYIYGGVGYERLHRLPGDFTLSAKVDLQWSDSRLLASEQFGAGGPRSVRGFESRVVSGDSGLFVSNEVRTPAYALPFTGDFDAGDVQLLAFLEYGRVETRSPLAGEAQDEELSSAGIGLRYTFSNHVSLEADYGWQISGRDLDPGQDGKAHLNLLLSF